MGKMCYLCRRKASQHDRISLHKFPKNPIARNKWMKTCDLLPSDDLTCIYICSLHFHAKDIDRGNEFQTRCTLKNGAVPSIDVPNQICFNNENIDTLNDGTENNAEINELQTAHVYEIVNESDNVVQNVKTFDNANTLEYVVGNPNTCDNGVNTNASDNVNNNIYVQELPLSIHVSDKVEESFNTTPKRRVFEPRYISEITISDFGSPERTKRILNLVQETDKKKSKLIKSLQARNRKLQKQISSLQQTIANLKKENTVSNGAGDILPVKAIKFDHSYAIRTPLKNNANRAHKSTKKCNYGQ